jgi:hypothetical protein
MAAQSLTRDSKERSLDFPALPPLVPRHPMACGFSVAILPRYIDVSNSAFADKSALAFITITKCRTATSFELSVPRPSAFGTSLANTIFTNNEEDSLSGVRSFSRHRLLPTSNH